jgi:16S rRNA (cytosine967-C5)-methyltransferase
VVVERGLAAARAALAAGDAALQDEAAAAVVALAAPRPGDAVLDVCAAPGGKALFAAARMGGVGRLVARDASAARLVRVAAAAAAQGVPRPFLTTVVGDGLDLAHDEECAGKFDVVLLDAPCSGTGVLAKRADLRWRRTEADVVAAADLQGRLLAAAATAVRRGGVLVYSTCSVEADENENVVAAFLASGAGAAFAVDPPPPGALPASVVTEGGCLQTLPHVHGTDGAFGVRLRRVG